MRGNPTMNPIHEAIIFAALKHNSAKNPNRKGTSIPYITHPMEVMQILTANNCSENVIVAGILHDTLEDTSTTPDEIDEKFGPEILEIVKTESEDKTKSWEERKKTTIEHLKTASLDAKLVCCADKLANIRSMAADKEEIGDRLWTRFNAPEDRIAWYYRSIAKVMPELAEYPMYQELNELVKVVFD